MADNVVILRVALDEGKTEAQLAKLVLDIEATRKAQQALTAERKAGTVSDEEFAKRTVELQTKLKGQQQEQSALTKNLDAYRSAIGKATGSVDQLKAQSALLTAEYNAMSQEQRENTEAGRELAAQLEATNKALLEAGQRVGDNRRNVGNYAATLRDAIKESGFFGGITAKVTEAQETFSKAQVIAKAAIGGNVTALGFLRLALLATGLGALVVVLGSVVAFLTKSQTGIDLVSRKFAGLKAVLDVVVGTAAEFGEKLFAALDNPKQAITDLIAFIEQNLVNRVKAIGLIFQGIADRDFRKANDGLIQLTVGITNASDKMAAFTKVASEAAKAGEAIEAESQRILAAERALNVERSQSRARIEELKKLSDDSTRSVAVRTAAAKQAATIENGLLAEQIKLQDDKIKNELAGQKLRKVVTNEDRDRLADLQRERADTQQESLTLQTELQNKINSLVQEGFDKTIEGRAQALALEKALLDKQLAQVKTNSDEELRLLQAKLSNARAAELNVKNLTVAQKKAIDVKYEQESQALLFNSIKARALSAYDAEAASINRELTLVKSGTDEETELRREAIRAQLAAQKAGLDVRKDNAQQIALLDANAAKAINDVDYGAALAKLDRFLQASRTKIEEANAQGLLTERAYTKAILANDSIAAGARLTLAKDYHQDTLAQERAAKDAQLAIQKQLTDQERANAEERKGIARSFGEEVGSLIADSLLEQGANIESFLGKVMILVLDVIEKQLIAQQIASVGSASVQAIAQPDSVASFGASGFVRIAILTAAITAAFELAKAGISAVSTPPKQFAQGTVLGGVSHQHGGVQLYSRAGHHFGEAEKDEIILTKGVWQNPLLRPLASQLNVLGGGQALMPNLLQPRMALGGVAQPLILDQLRGNAGQGIDYKQLGKVLADELRRNPPRNVWSDFKAAEKRNIDLERRTSF